MLLVLVALVPASLLLLRTAAETYVVGNELSWQIPPNTTAYSTWAFAYTFHVGDTLVFNFVTGSHDVTKVTKEAFDACDSSSPIILLTNGPANYTPNTTGENYFFCAVDDHCSRGQKLSIFQRIAFSSSFQRNHSHAATSFLELCLVSGFCHLLCRLHVHCRRFPVIIPSAGRCPPPHVSIILDIVEFRLDTQLELD